MTSDLAITKKMAQERVVSFRKADDRTLRGEPTDDSKTRSAAVFDVI
jgi:hypothetical protein